jgi:hypothetical protein
MRSPECRLVLLSRPQPLENVLRFGFLVYRLVHRVANGSYVGLLESARK